MPNLLPKLPLFSISAAKLRIIVVLLQQKYKKITMMLTNCLKRYPLSHLVAVVIVILSLYPFGEIEIMGDVPLADKWTHMVMYGGLCLIIWYEYLRSHKSINAQKITLYGYICPVAMSGLLELAQEYLTTCRSGEWLDLLANTTGATLTYLIGWLILKRFVQSKK
jgi:VanZ family protein